MSNINHAHWSTIFKLHLKLNDWSNKINCSKQKIFHFWKQTVDSKNSFLSKAKIQRYEKIPMFSFVQSDESEIGTVLNLIWQWNNHMSP